MKYLLSITLFILCMPLCAQVGINITSPLGVLHVDPLGDTQKSGTTFSNDSEDFIVTNDGKVGIGTANPQKKLDVEGTFRYDTGAQKDGYMLQSDANGNASWVAQIPPNDIIGANEGTSSYQVGLKSPISTASYVNASITLPAGLWQITFNGTYNGDGTSGFQRINIIWDLSTSSTTNTVAGRCYSYPVSVPSGTTNAYSTVAAMYLVSPTTTTTYYIWGTPTPNNTSLRYSGEGRLWAIRIN